MRDTRVRPSSVACADVFRRPLSIDPHQTKPRTCGYFFVVLWMTIFQEVTMLKPVAAGLTAVCAGILCAAPFSVSVSPDAGVSLSLDTAAARIGRPLTPMSVAGVDRRAIRRLTMGTAPRLASMGMGTARAGRRATTDTHTDRTSRRPTTDPPTGRTNRRPITDTHMDRTNRRATTGPPMGRTSRRLTTGTPPPPNSAYYRPYRSLYAYAPYRRRFYPY